MEPWFKKNLKDFIKIFFMHNSVQSHSVKKTNEYLNKTVFKETHLIKLPGNSQNHNPIK